jgi:hypothetical protein
MSFAETLISGAEESDGKYSLFIDTLKITALSNHKPGILNNYNRICNNMSFADY